MKKICWTVMAVVTNDNQFIDLGRNPKGGAVFDENNKIIEFISYDGAIKVDRDDVVYVVEDNTLYDVEEFEEGDLDETNWFVEVVKE